MSTSLARWFEWLRWMMLMGAMTWTASGVAQETANRLQPPSAGSSNNSLSSDSSASKSLSDSVRELREQVRELQAAVAGMRSDWQHARVETEELRRELDGLRAGEAPAGTEPRNAVLRDAVAKSATGNSEEAAGNTPKIVQRILQNVVPDLLTDNAPQDEKEDRKRAEHAASLEEEYQLLSGKVDEQYQTKVESASKYRLRLSGIVLMNLVSNQGVVDSIDLPMLAYARPEGNPGGSFGAT